MRQIHTFADTRLGGACYLCGGIPDTRDHVPPKAFLDEPYPTNLPVVAACAACNNGASKDEAYLACLLEVAACHGRELERGKIARTLARNPALNAALGRATNAAEGRIEFDLERVERVLRKIALGLWNFETAQPTSTLHTEIDMAPVHQMSDLEWQRFTSVGPPEILPEVGSRLMIQFLENAKDSGHQAWEGVQHERFTYAIDIAGGRQNVKMILRNFLAAQVDISEP